MAFYYTTLKSLLPVPLPQDPLPLPGKCLELAAPTKAAGRTGPVAKAERVLSAPSARNMALLP